MSILLAVYDMFKCQTAKPLSILAKTFKVSEVMPDRAQKTAPKKKEKGVTS
jgi:hypothetical protein